MDPRSKFLSIKSIPLNSVKLPKRKFVECAKVEALQCRAIVDPINFKPTPEKAPVPIRVNFLDDSERDESFGIIDFWFRKSSLKPLLIIGHTGSGKTALVNHYGKNVEFYEDDKDAEDFLQNQGLRVRGPGVFENIESLDTSTRDCIRLAIREPSKFRKLVLTADDIFEEPAKSWAKACTVVRLEKPSNSFIRKVIKSRSDITENIISTIIESCNNNLAVASNLLYWATMKSFNFDKIDMPMGVPKATRCCLMGEKVPCLGGSSDIGFLAQMIQVNLPQTNCSIETLAKSLERFSMLDTMEAKNELDSESHWTVVEAIVSDGPKLRGSKFQLEWPRSSKKSLKPKFPYS